MIYLDTNIIIYAIENHPKYGDACIRILKAINDNQQEMCASVLVLIEVINVLTKINRLLSKQKKDLLDVPKNIDAILSLPITWFELDFVVIRRAAEYSFSIVGVDYFHVASMELHSISQIVSADKELDKVPFIKRLDPLNFST
ncbi:MAG: type II toxin-antitoxin system VapC family toxin [Candidatus Ranarchaeia archaeon]